MWNSIHTQIINEIILALNLDHPPKTSIENLQECIQDICIWMWTNLLKLNDVNTEFLLVGTMQQLTKVGDISMKIENDVIWPADQVRNLGVYLNNLMTTTAHVNKLCGQLSSTIHAIACRHNVLNRDTTKIVMQSPVLSRLDYCKSQLTESSKKDIQNLQCTKNMEWKVIFNLHKYNSITPYHISLHWLKVE